VTPEEHLAPYAQRSDRTRGRVHEEAGHPYRGTYQRDRDRIIHSTAFRRLEYKTQVFVNHEGDHYRTRLTHTIEVAQIARSIARALRLNEDLAESISLAHDLGHTPFGHTGERVMNELMKEHGGFEHNRQSLRVVEKLEERYACFAGLNLTWETREGIIKHSSYYDHPEVKLYLPEEQPSLEAQIIDYADEIAYNNHDLDDGLSSGLINLDEVKELALWKRVCRAVDTGPEGSADRKILIRTVIRGIINLLATDLIETTRGAIETLGIQSFDDVKKAGRRIVGLDPAIERENGELKEFLMHRLYQHYRVVRMGIKAQRVLTDLFSIYQNHPGALSDSYSRRIGADGLEQTISDYIAGMTDRYALEEHQKLTDPMIRV